MKYMRHNSNNKYTQCKHKIEKRKINNNNNNNNFVSELLISFRLKPLQLKLCGEACEGDAS